MLLERPGEIVTREELRDPLWPSDTFVDFDHGLNNAVMRVREVLLDSSDHPRYVETIPRRGYRFVAPVEDVPASSAVSGKGESERTSSAAVLPAPVESNVALVSLDADRPRGQTVSRHWLSAPRIAIVVFIALVGLIVLAAFFLRGNRNSVGVNHLTHSTALVVLPLENLSGDKDQDYFADGMTDELIANLAKIRSLHVISRSTAMAYKGTRKPQFPRATFKRATTVARHASTIESQYTFMSVVALVADTVVAYLVVAVALRH